MYGLNSSSLDVWMLYLYHKSADRAESIGLIFEEASVPYSRCVKTPEKEHNYIVHLCF